MKFLKVALSTAASLVLLSACAQSPTGRNQLLIFSNAEMSTMGVQAFDQMKSEQQIHRGGSKNRYVSCVADAITSVLPPAQQQGWEVVVFEDDSANAFALPGGKIGVHTGLLNVTASAAQLAAVIGHEVGHVIASHSNERMSVQFVSQTGSQLVGAIAQNHPQSNAIMGALGLGMQFGVLMPYGRTQETESDHIGVELMSKAGFDPREAIQLWYNMSRTSGGEQPPEFLSTHPSHETRIRDLEALMAKYEPVYQQARASGRRPNCD